MNDSLKQRLLKSGLFDEHWYLERYPDAQMSQLRAIEHFLHYGWPLGRSPGPFFDPIFYRHHYADIAQRGLDPLKHFLEHGMAEQRQGYSTTGQSTSFPRIAVVLHAYHLDLVSLLGDRLAQLAVPFDLYVTTPHKSDTPEIEALKGRFACVEIVTCPNRGRDIEPFFSLMSKLAEYELCLKLHTKQGVTAVAKQWREELLDGVLPAPPGLGQLVSRLASDKALKLAGSKRLFMSQQAMRFGNGKWLQVLAQPLGIPFDTDWGFFAGSMFWCRPAALLPLAEEVSRHSFEIETGQQDGELAHALERLTGGAVHPQEGQVLLVKCPSSGAISLETLQASTPLEKIMPSRLLEVAVEPVKDIQIEPVLEMQTTPGVTTNNPDADKSIAGDLNLDGGNAIRGWLASRADAAPRQAIIRIDGSRDIETLADHFRTDLKANGLHQGRHAFDLYPPLELLDGQSHRVELIDAQTRQSIALRDVNWALDRDYDDFQGYLAHGLVDPYVSQPFREADKRCFAAMENVANRLAGQALALDTPPLVSIIMPCYNRLDTIEDAVKSVLAQSYAHFELLLIDDGSEDGTAQWCERCAADYDRVKALCLGRNSGVSAARNAGLEASRGVYILYLDSDNRWDSRFVAATVGAFIDQPDTDAFYSGLYRYHGNDATPVGIMFGPLNRSLLFNRNYIDLNTFAHTREAWQRLGGFDESLPRYVDWDLVRRYASSSILRSLPVLLTHYYIDKAANSLTNNQAYLPYLNAVREKTGVTFGVGSGSVAPHDASKQSAQFSGQGVSLTKRISVIVPSYESQTDLAECLQSLHDLKIGSLLEIVVVDNASSKPVCDFIRNEQESGRIKAVFNDANFGFTHAVNLGIQAASPDSDIVLLNNDALVTSGALEAMQQAAYSLPQCGLVVPQQVLPGGTKTLNEHVPYADSAYPCDVNLSRHHDNVQHVPLFHDGRALEITFAPFFCVYIPRDVYRKAGDLDAQNGRHYRSDRIYCDVVRHILGLKIYHVSDALIYHKLQKSTAELADKEETDFDVMFRQNRWDADNKLRLGFVDAPWDV